MEISDQGKIPKLEYPRPQFIRENNWFKFNGEWDFAFDDLNLGLREKRCNIYISCFYYRKNNNRVQII